MTSKEMQRHVTNAPNHVKKGNKRVHDHQKDRKRANKYKDEDELEVIE